MKDKMPEDKDLEQKLHAFFQDEADKLAPTDDMWEQVERRLGRQDNPSWFAGRRSFRWYALRRVLGAVALLFAMVTVAFFIIQMAAGPDTATMPLGGTEGSTTPSVSTPMTATPVPPTQGAGATATPLVP